MFDFKIFYAGVELCVVCDQAIDNIVKIASFNDHVFILTADKQLLFGSIDDSLQRTSIKVDVIRTDVIDVACSVDSIYVVDDSGCVQHCPVLAFEYDKHWNDIQIVNYSAIYEGISTDAIDTTVRVCQVNCNDDGALFITTDRKLYAIGNFGEVCTADQPILVQQFINYEILQIAMGKHFAVVLTRKRIPHDGLEKTASHQTETYDENLKMMSNLSLNTTSKSVTPLNDDSLNLSDISFLDITKSAANSNLIEECETPTPSVGTLDSQSMLSVNSGSLKTITNNTETESNSSSRNSLPFNIEQEISKLTKIGNDQIRTQVWCFGSVNRGQLGTGDHIKRKQAIEVIKLTEQGVQSVVCGDEHTAALTLDGRLYLWGDNSNEQISHWLEKEDCSSPKRYYKTEQNILSAQCGQHSTFILTNCLDQYELSRNKHFPNMQVSHGQDEIKRCNQYDYLLLANKQYLVVGQVFKPLRFEKFLKFEQQFLQDILQKTRPNLQQFLRTMHRNMVKYPSLYRQFSHQYNSITELTAINVISILNFAKQLIDVNAIAFIRYHSEFINIFRSYTQRYCEIICSDDFGRTCQYIIPNSDFTSKFSTPLQHTANYIEFLHELIESVASQNETVKIVLGDWEKFRSEMDLMLKHANQTISFWNANQKNIPVNLQLPSRRIVIDSKEIPLKLINSSRFSSNWFILFNDIFCHSTGSSSSMKQYSLKTLWIHSVNDKDVSPSSSSSSSNAAIRKNALKIVTPEEQFVVAATNHEAKMRWLHGIERQIRESLDKTNSKSNLMRRMTSYTFTDKHRVYPQCKYLGQWYHGKMHGIGCMEYPTDGRIYTGQFDMNVINGYGRLNVPNITCYEGRFIGGKYHGFGTLETHSVNENYEGAFRMGHKHGFGVLIDNNRTYIGDFANGLPHGYGVLDDSDSGDKYMGMFHEGDRSGHGFCITGDGKYFEGNFVDNQLNGNGVGVFTSGSYYEGDLTVLGPIGRGSMFLPVEPVKDEHWLDFENQKPQMRGNILSGSLNGNWENVKINNGNISIGQVFGKYPSIFTVQQIDNGHKWLTLFSDWEVDVFGTVLSEINDTKLIWHKIHDYQQTIKQNAQLKSTISTSAILYENGHMSKTLSHRHQYHHNQSHADHFLQVIESNSNDDRQVSKSFSLSRITGKNYKRNLLAIERTKSISNEFLNNAVNFLHDENQSPTECNNNGEIENSPDRSLMLNKQSTLPCFGISKLDKDDLRLVRDYLTKAFKNQQHPLGILNSKISYCFYTSYGCWKVKPMEFLSTHAMNEWESISKRIYDIVRKLFPTLPPDYGTLDEEFISHRSLLYPILLSEGVYSTLFVLYANKCSKRDEIYRQRILFAEKKTDLELIEFLKIPSNYLPLIQHDEFSLAIEALRQVKEKFCPREMLKLIELTFVHVENAAESASSPRQVNSDTPSAVDPSTEAPIPHESPKKPATQALIVQLNADTMMPLTIYLLLRAAIPHLGTEILLLEDLMGKDFEFVMHGFAGYCFTTIKAAYQHIINESFSQN